MKKAVVIGLSVLALGSAQPAFADDGYFSGRGDRIDRRLDNRGDRINDRLDARGDRINDRFDNRGDRINDHLDAKGDRINDRFDARAEKARAEGQTKRAARLDQLVLVTKTGCRPENQRSFHR